MTEVLPDPYEEFLAQDPSILREPDPLQPEDPSVIPFGKVALGLGAAYLAYRSYMRHQLKNSLKQEVTRKSLLYTASAIWNAFVPKWVSMTAPYLAAGYLEGMRAAKAGKVPEPLLRQIAEGYAEELGRHINEVSTEAMLSGFNAQVNRKVPPALAGKRVADAYGVTRRSMNALVNVWTAEEQKKLTDLPLPSAKEERAKYIIETQNALRARQVGETEAWTAKTQAKQIVWMYGQQHGVIPAEARRIWITAHDERVCPTCGPMDGKEVAVGEKFVTDTGELWTPPAHVNCRCDVALDLTPDVAMQRGITELLEAEAVTKAYGQDPYDRDPAGRFARTESRGARRPVQTKEENALLAQVNRQLQELEQERLTERRGLRPPLKKIGPRRPLRRPPQLQSVGAAGPRVGPKLGPQRPKPKLRINRGTLYGPPKVPPKGPAGRNGDWWPLPGYSLAGLFEEDSPTLHSKGDTIYTRRNQNFFEKHGAYVPGDGMKAQPLDQAIEDYWYDQHDAAVGEYRDRNNPRIYHQGDVQYVIDADAYAAALEAQIAGLEHGHGEDVELEVAGTTRVDRYGRSNRKITVDSVELAEYLDLKTWIDATIPTLIEIHHMNPHAFESTRAGFTTISGVRWNVVATREEEGDLHHLPYTVLELEPIDVDDWEQ